MRILKIRAEMLGDRWDFRYHAKPTATSSRSTMALRAIATLRRGYSASTKEYVAEDAYNEKKVPYIRISDIVNRTISDKLVEYVLETPKIPRSARAKANEILISVAGTIGKVGLVSAQFAGAVVSSQLAILSPQEEYVSSNYLVRALESRFVKEQMLRVQTGAVIKHLPTGELGQLRVSIPDKATQLRILHEIQELESEYGTTPQYQEELENQIDSILEGV